jgi:hypothetical protein
MKVSGLAQSEYPLLDVIDRLNEFRIPWSVATALRSI